MILSGQVYTAGFLVMTAVWGGDPSPISLPAKVYRFGEQTIIIQPGPVAGSPPQTAIRPGNAALIRQASYHQDAGDAESFDSRLPSVGIDTTTEDSPELPPRPEAETSQPLAFDPVELGRLYREIYAAIPFDRAEYEANPSYRHEATLEFLFGQQRPMVVERRHIKVDIQGLPGVWPAVISPLGVPGWWYPFHGPGYRVHRSF